MTSPAAGTAVLAKELERAWGERRPVEPFSQRGLVGRIEEAYEAQRAWNELRLAGGEKVVGRKIGLTSRAVQEQMKVSEPDFGTLWGSRYFASHGGRTRVPYDLFIQPRAEGELAFLIGNRLGGEKVTAQEVLAATEAVAPAFEIVDSRISDWRIGILDTVADNASYGAFTLGPWSRKALREDLRLVGMVMSRRGEVASQGVGAACLGHPARAVAWLATTLTRYGVSLEPGDIVLSGALAPMLPCARGDDLLLEMTGFAPLAIHFD